MYFESIGKDAEADVVYTNALDAAPQHGMMLHRKIACKKSRGDLAGALELLHAHVSVHMMDWRAWYEAAKIHISLGAYTQAIFCLEEVILARPFDVSIQLLLADALYAAGGRTNLENARKYYAGVIEVTNGENARALYGICLCTSKLISMGVLSGKDSLGTAAAQTLVEKYAAIPTGPSTSLGMSFCRAMLAGRDNSKSPKIAKEKLVGTDSSMSSDTQHVSI